MEGKLQTVCSGEERKNVSHDEDDDEIEEPEVQAERPAICLCQKSKFQRKFIGPFVSFV